MKISREYFRWIIRREFFCPDVFINLLAQWLMSWTHNPRVRGSIQSRSESLFSFCYLSNFRYQNRIFCVKCDTKRQGKYFQASKSFSLLLTTLLVSDYFMKNIRWMSSKKKQLSRCFEFLWAYNFRNAIKSSGAFFEGPFSHKK